MNKKKDASDRLVDRQVRVRLRWIEHYENITKKVAPTCRYFGITRTTFYRWYNRYMSLGIEGLKDRSSRPYKIRYQIPHDIVQTILMLRHQRGYGPARMSYYLKKKYNWFVSTTTIWHIYKRHGLNRLRYKKYWKRYPQRYSKEIPGERLQMDVKFLEKLGHEGKRYYQFTVIDDCTRFRVLRIYDSNTVKNAIGFVNEVQKVLPFAIKEIQTDNGQEFSERFSWHLEDLGIEHRKTKVRSPEENGKVERSHRTDGEEFYRTKRFVSVGHCIRLLKQWEREYNEERPHMALKGKTPKEYLLEKLQNHVSTKIKNMPIKTVAEAG